MNTCMSYVYVMNDILLCMYVCECVYVCIYVHVYVTIYSLLLLEQDISYQSQRINQYYFVIKNSF